MSVFKEFPGLENLEKKFKDFQRLSRTRKSPASTSGDGNALYPVFSSFGTVKA